MSTQPTSAARPSRKGQAQRVTAIIDALGDAPDIGVRDLAAKLDISRSAVHRVAQILTTMRVLRLLPSGRYSAGARLIAWAALLERTPLLRTAEQALAALRDQTGETVLLLGYRPGDDRALVLAVWPGSNRLRYTVGVGAPVPLHAGAGGKAILAQLDDEFVDSLPLPRLATRTPSSHDELRHDLAETRERGYAQSSDERLSAAAGVAAAYFRSDRVAGSVNVTFPRDGSREDPPEHYGTLVQEAAETLTAALREGAAESPAAVAAPPIQSGNGRDVARVVAVLDALIRAAVWGQGVRADEFAAQVSTAPATAEALLERLAAEGLVRRGPNGAYEPDVRLLSWASRFSERDVAHIASDLLSDLTDAVQETVYLLRYDPETGEARFVGRRMYERSIQYVVDLGSTAPLHAGASGRAILAFLDRSTWRSSPLPRYSDTTVTSIETLDRELEAIRRDGYAVSIGEHIPGVAGIAAPYFVDGAIAGAISVALPQSRYDESAVPAIAASLTAATHELTALLSSRAEPASD